MQHIPGHTNAADDAFISHVALFSFKSSSIISGSRSLVNLTIDVQCFQSAALAESMSSIYATALRSYLLFCQQTPLQDFPLQETVLTVLLFCFGSAGGIPHHKGILVGASVSFSYEGLSLINM